MRLAMYLVKILSVSLFATGALSNDFSGFYAGLHTGSAKITSNNTSTTEFAETNGSSLRFNAGYNYDISGGLIVGGELGYSADNGYYGTNNASGSTTRRTLTANLPYAGIQLGFQTGSLLSYISGGLLFSNSISTKVGDNDATDITVDNGSYVGLGLRYIVTDNIHGVFEMRRNTMNTADETFENNAMTAGFVYSF